MRWADSDSSEEEEYVPSQPQMVEPEEMEVAHSSTPSPPPRERQKHDPDRRGSNNPRGNRGPARHEQQQQHQQHQQQHQQRGGNKQNNRDWRQMAKASSRFSSNHEVGGPVDGSAWMAQRRAKMEDSSRDQRAKQEELKQQQFQEKRERRKSQLDALKAAMTEIKQSEPPPTSPRTSLQQAATLAKPLPKAPLQILSREKKDTGKEVNNKDNISQQRNNDQKDDAGPPALVNLSISKPQPHSYSITIGSKQAPKPKGELQPDGTVIFVRRTSDELNGKQENLKEDLPAILDKVDQADKQSTPADCEDKDQTEGSPERSRENSKEGDESSMTSKESKRTWGKNRRKSDRGRDNNESIVTEHRSRGSGRGRRDGRGRGRGGLDDSGRNDCDNTSVDTNRSKDSRGRNRNNRGGGGRGRGRGSRYHDVHDDAASHRTRGERGRGRGGRRDQNGRHADGFSASSGRGRGRDHSRGRGPDAERQRDTRSDGNRGRGRGRGHRGGRASRGNSPQHSYEIGKT